MRLKIPAIRESKKRPYSEPAPPPDHTPSPFPLEVPRPISYESGKFWTPAEVDHIFKLQEHLQKQAPRLRIRDFSTMWHEQKGRCALTGASFCVGGEYHSPTFDVGIDRFDKNREFNKKNARLVLLPLSYSRCRSGVYSIDFPPAWMHKGSEKRPVAHAILLHIRDALMAHKPSRHYAVAVRYGVRSPDIDIKHWIFPITRWYRRKETEDNLKTICTVTVDDDKQELVITGRRGHGGKEDRYTSTVRSFSLFDPTIDYVEHFLRIYAQSFKAQLHADSRHVIENWKY